MNDQATRGPTRRTVIAGMAAGGAAAWAAPQILSQPAAGATTGAPAVANFINARLPGPATVPAGFSPIPMTTVLLSSGGFAPGGTPGQIVCSVAGNFRIAFSATATAAPSEVAMLIAPAGPAATLQAQTFETMHEVLVPLGAGDVVEVVNNAGIPVNFQAAWITITELL